MYWGTSNSRNLVMRTNWMVLPSLCLSATSLRADAIHLAVNGVSDYKIVISR